MVSGRWALPFLIALSLTACTRTMAIRVNPPEALVTIDGVPLQGNAIEYGRWVGNEYRLRVEAPGYETEERVLDVQVPGWAAAAAGPLWWPWLGELPSQIHVELKEASGERTSGDSPTASE